MKTFLFALLFLIAFVSYGQNHHGHRKVLDVKDIENIEIMKINKENPHKYQSKMLNTNQYADFAEKWNTAKHLGHEKFKLIDYYIIVTLKDGEKRQFTISGSNAVGCRLQESENATFELKDKAYFDNIWLAIR